MDKSFALFTQVVTSSSRKGLVLEEEDEDEERDERVGQEETSVEKCSTSQRDDKWERYLVANENDSMLAAEIGAASSSRDIRKISGILLKKMINIKFFEMQKSLIKLCSLQILPWRALRYLQVHLADSRGECGEVEVDRGGGDVIQ